MRTVNACLLSCLIQLLLLLLIVVVEVRNMLVDLMDGLLSRTTGTIPIGLLDAWAGESVS